MKIIVGGREQDRELLCDGVAKAGEAYLICCSITDTWCYCSAERFERLVAKFGSTEAVGKCYVSRSGKSIRDTL